MTTTIQRPEAAPETLAETSTTPAGRLAAAMLSRTAPGGASSYPRYTFSFTPFLQATYHHGLAADRPVCKAYSAGHCPLGARCPDRHSSAAAAATAMANAAAGGGGHSGGSFRDNQGFISLVCKHWLRGLCKKGEGCEFLHEYNLRKMPECNFFLRNGYCSNGDECLYLHIDPRSKLPPCPDYDNRGFCALGPRCPKKHVRRKAVCPYYLAGFCPDGARLCKEGGHPKWSPVAIVAPQVAAEQAAAAAAAAAAAEAGIDVASLDNGNSMGSPLGGGMGGDDYGTGGADGDGHGHGHGHGGYQQQQQQSHFQHGGHARHGGGDDYRGGFNKGGGRGGRWRGRGGGRGGGFRGRGRGDH